MQPVPMETLTPIKYESNAFYHYFSRRSRTELCILLTGCGRSGTLLSTVSPMTGSVLSELGRKDSSCSVRL